MTTLDTIIITNITAQLDEVALSLAGVPGRTPQDAQNAATLLAYVMAKLYGEGRPSRLLLNTLERRGVSGCEAEAVALALEALVLRLGAWLGRTEQ